MAKEFKEEGIGTQEEHRDNEVPLACLPGSIPAVEQSKERRAQNSGEPIIGPRDDDHGPGGGTHETDVEDSPRQRTLAKHMHHAPVRKVDARHVDLEQIAVGRHSVIHQEAEVTQLRRIVDLLPVGGAKKEDAGTDQEINGDEYFGA